MAKFSLNQGRSGRTDISNGEQIEIFFLPGASNSLSSSVTVFVNKMLTQKEMLMEVFLPIIFLQGTTKTISLLIHLKLLLKIKVI